jgi:putative (di)nucleoside polyphosphate hydrolase
MLLNSERKVWVGARIDNRADFWQMPQGGIDEGEDPRQACLRELFEETGVRSAHILAEAPQWFNYDLPEHLIGKSWGGRYRGQTQKWFAVRFTGAESEIDLKPPGHKQEFDVWRWADMDDVVHDVVPFKRDVYRRVVDSFRHLGA